MRELLGVRFGKFRQSNDEQAERGDALLTINDEELVYPGYAELVTQHHDHGPGEMRTGLTTADGDDVIPKLPALFLVPGVGTLVDRYDHSLIGRGKQTDD